jgi:sulfur transfer protein SufE
VLAPGGTLTLHFAVENPSGVSAKALAAILHHGLSGLGAAEVSSVTPELVFDVFRRDISMGKGLGLMSMVRAVQVIAKQAADATAADPDASGIFPRQS